MSIRYKDCHNIYVGILSTIITLWFMEEQQATKYINGLKYIIPECVILHDVFSIVEAHNKVLKIEDYKAALSTSIKKSASDIRVQPSSTMVDLPPTRQSTNASALAPAIIVNAAAKCKENS